MPKNVIKTIHEKNTIINNIINAMAERKSFLVCGHKNPDEDCISSLVAISLLLNKFDREIQVYLNGKIPDNINYLMNICKYNHIDVINNRKPLRKNIDTIILCDTPKQSMLDISNNIEKLLKKKNILKIEIDHHIASDSSYIGDEGYCLVTDASSASELIGQLALKLNKRKDILKKFLISDPFSRNFILAIVTGIVGDTNMGQFLKSRKEKKYYEIFSRMFNKLLMNTTIRESNFLMLDEVFTELQKLTEEEEKCYLYILKKHKLSKSIGYATLTQKESQHLFKNFNKDVVISVTRSIANVLADKSKKLSLVSYFDDKKDSDFIQFRMRRSSQYKNFDLRNILEICSIANGGGHEGAIGFRVPRSEIDNLNIYVQDLITKTENELI